MQAAFEIIPVLLFFIGFKFYDMYVATIIGIASTAAFALVSRIINKRWDNKQLITLLIFILFGGMTLYFHNPLFVKWKPTVIYWVFATVLLISQFLMGKLIIKNLFKSILQPEDNIPNHVWQKINVVWTVFFIALGFINLYVAYHYDSNTWVNFKFYGVTLAFFALSFGQAWYLMRYLNGKTS